MNWTKIKQQFFKYWILPWGACIFLAMPLYAGPTDDNHIHVEQVGSGDDLN